MTTSPFGPAAHFCDPGTTCVASAAMVDDRVTPILRVRLPPDLIPAADRVAYRLRFDAVFTPAGAAIRGTLLHYPADGAPVRSDFWLNPVSEYDLHIVQLLTTSDRLCIDYLDHELHPVLRATVPTDPDIGVLAFYTCLAVNHTNTLPWDRLDFPSARAELAARYP